jgi:predicted enzyme related to lactoylglutathione lyase
MELVQSRIVTDDVEGLAAFYAQLVGTPVALNAYYVEVPAGPTSVGFSKCRFTEYGQDQAARPEGQQPRDEIILDFMAGDVDAEYERIAALGVAWVMLPTTQPWGNRSMIFRDPEGTSSACSRAARGLLASPWRARDRAAGPPRRVAASGC